ncbi:MAG TPA: NisI/SpaI family lantibiotic immunity lipoprotein [Alphaproteobacteria bacterium]|nr:NisI/SpaI family lantibiotic immunity lipoprotein [Alphaproteobacteria bacterium]HRX58429.1 NisI/SpaI family lantibiotic immunity lipoprotein [Eubacteriales bacterium]
MKNKTLAYILSAVLLTGLLSACSVLSIETGQCSSDKEECSLNTDNVTQFTYKEKNYTILEDTVSEEDLGSWVGYIRKLAVLDLDGKILLQQDTEKTTIKSLADIADTQPDAAYIIPFLNVYACKDETLQELLVDANGGYHKAILSDSVTASDDIFHYDRQQTVPSDGDFSVNPQDCTQLIRGDQVYQITDETVPDEQVGEYLAIIAKSIVFDKDTKLEISEKDLETVDWDGNGLSTQKRENWFYGEVHTIQNTDASDSVAVEINSEYRIATCR